MVSQPLTVYTVLLLLLLHINIRVAPSFYCQALFYKKCLPYKVVMSLAVLQDLPSSNEVCTHWVVMVTYYYFV